MLLASWLDGSLTVTQSYSTTKAVILNCTSEVTYIPFSPSHRFRLRMTVPGKVWLAFLFSPWQKKGYCACCDVSVCLHVAWRQPLLGHSASFWALRCIKKQNWRYLEKSYLAKCTYFLGFVYFLCCILTIWEAHYCHQMIWCLPKITPILFNRRTSLFILIILLPKLNNISRRQIRAHLDTFTFVERVWL